MRQQEAADRHPSGRTMRLGRSRSSDPTMGSPPTRTVTQARLHVGQTRRETSDKLAARYRRHRSVTDWPRRSLTSRALDTSAGHWTMRVSAEHNTETPAPPGQSADPSAPDLSFLTGDPAAALQSFYNTIDRIGADNPV